MKGIDFVRPMRAKLVIFAILAVYVFVSSVFLSQFDTTRSLGERPYAVPERLGIFVAYPGSVLMYPFVYISQYTFTGETTLRQMYEESGAVALPASPNPQYDRPLKTTTPWGTIAGFMSEIILLYILACFLALLKPRRR